MLATAVLTLNMRDLVDRLVGDPHGLIIREIDRQPIDNLLRTSSSSPPACPSTEVVSPPPLRPHRARYRRSVKAPDHPGQPILDVVAEPVVVDGIERGRTGRAADWQRTRQSRRLHPNCPVTNGRRANGVGTAAARPRRGLNVPPGTWRLRYWCSHLMADHLAKAIRPGRPRLPPPSEGWPSPQAVRLLVRRSGRRGKTRRSCLDAPM